MTSSSKLWTASTHAWRWVWRDGGKLHSSSLILLQPQDFCKHVVDPLGRDVRDQVISWKACHARFHVLSKAETLALDALPQQLGVGLRMWILDRRDEAPPDSQRTTTCQLVEHFGAHRHWVPFRTSGVEWKLGKPGQESPALLPGTCIRRKL